MFIIFASNINQWCRLYCFLQICTNAMQNSIFKKFSCGMQMIMPPILNILASMQFWNHWHLPCCQTESKCIVILEKDNLKHQCNVKMHPKKKIAIIAMNIREKPAVLLQRNNSLLYQSFPSPLKLMQLMMTSRSADFKCSSIHLRMKEKKKNTQKTTKQVANCTNARRERKRTAADSGAIAE